MTHPASRTPDVVHLVVGPARHGVVRHAMQVAAVCGDRVLRVPEVASLPSLPAAAVVHVPFTDRLFGTDISAAVAAFDRLAARVAGLGCALSVTLHDVPHDDTPVQRLRRAGYRRVARAARGVVVNSRVELALVEDWCPDARSLRLAPLPIVRGTDTPATWHDPDDALPVGVLGFVYPDRGYEDVLAAVTRLGPHVTVTAIGAAADGHDDLLRDYGGHPRWRCTGYVPDGHLAARLATTAVPVAPNRRSTASASINSWLAIGRRPLVPDSPLGRELTADRPGAITLYDPDDPAGLAELIGAALADPSLTRLAAGTYRGPSLDDVAAIHAQHFATCAPDVARPVPGGVVVPDNRWDLVPRSVERRSVGVVVPYFEAQSGLDAVLAALAAQTVPAAEIVVADDGSAAPPDVRAAGDRPVRVVRQDDHGFRAARARNLGAAACSSDVVVFVDGDTVPEPGFLAALTRLPSACPDVVAVGRRRHRDASGDVLPEPPWLRDAYRDTDDLLRCDRRSYRYLISAGLAVPRRLFESVGGFDERFVGYGGEDWELAHRLRTAGAVFAHVPDAVAWHEGPDWAARGDPQTRRVEKNGETAALALLLPDPDSRGAGRWGPYPSVVVHGGIMSDVDALATVRSAGDADCGFWFDAVQGPRADLLRPVVPVGTPPADVVARAWCQVWLHGPCDLGRLTAIATSAERYGRVDAPALTARSTRSLARAGRLASDAGRRDRLADELFGRRDGAGPSVEPVDDLHRRLRPQAAG